MEFKQKEVLNLSAKLWNKFLDIPKDQRHGDDINDVRFHINAIQSILYTQIYKIDNEKECLKQQIPTGLIKR